MRNAFWKLSARLLRYKRQLGVAMGGALLSAVCFGAGLSLMLPVLQLFFGHDAADASAHPLHDFVRDRLGGEDAGPWRRELAESINGLIPQDVFWSFTLVVGVIALLSILGSIGRYVHELYTITIVQHAATTLREDLFRKVLHAPLGRLGRDDGSGFSSRIVVDSTVVARGQLAILSKAVADAMKGLAAFGAALVMSWQLTAFVLIAAIPIALVLRVFGRTIRRASRRALKEQASMLKVLNEVFNALPVVKTSNAEGYERRRFRRVNRRMFAEQMRARQAKALASPVVETLSLVIVMGAAIVAAWWVFRPGGPEPAEFLTVLLLLGAAGASMRPVTGVHVQIKESQAAAERLLEGLAIESEPVQPETRRALPVLRRHHESVAFDAVSFRYPGATRWALRDVSLSVPHGATVAVVGPNGAGKSTVLSMLPRLIEPTSGRVLIDGQDLAGVNLRVLREQIAVVTQQTHLFEGTIADNIAYGRRYITRERIIAASRTAHADDFIAEHDDGYDRLLGEAGEGLSGGQKQRIAIARAILRDPAILILDEATSQIDAHSEARIADALREIRRGRTTFIIAHRLSTVVDSDLIVVMVDGAIADQGTHAELLARCPTYKTLTRTQLRPAEA